LDAQISARSAGPSISPGALAAVFALLAAVTVGIGIGFAAFGAWMVLPFAGLEALALVVAFFAWARRAPGGGEAVGGGEKENKCGPQIGIGKG
jgi:uncharacterized membrane protein